MAEWQLHEGDCLEVMRSLPGESVDAVVTDPPYCSGGFTEAGRQMATKQGVRSSSTERLPWFGGDNMTTGGFSWLMREFAVQALRMLRDGGSMLTFTDWRMYLHIAPVIESAGFRLQNLVVWDKGRAGLGTGFRARHEMIMHFVKGCGVFHDKTVGNVIQTARVHHTERQHQTQKPVELIETLLRVVTKEGDTVLDPFAGSGSTLVAALQMGRKAIGIERESAYCNIIRQRMAAVQQPLPLAK